MKIHRQTKHSSKLVKLKLIKTKIYKSNDKNFTKIEDVVYKLKKALHIIYKYHINNKRILFVGTPIENPLNDIIKTTKHLLIAEKIWMNGIITNQSSWFKSLSKNQKTLNRKVSTVLFKTKQKSDLIVILDSSSNFNAIKEGYVAKIPVISLNLNKNKNYGYNIPGNFKFTSKKTRDNFFYSMLSSTLRKGTLNIKK